MPEKTLAMYIRLSVEDGDLRSSTDKSESNSVTNQRKILQSYIEQTHDLLSYRITEFCDDGYSGTSFERPNFKRMMELVRRGALHCIIVKDLSRFGREYLEVGAYLELILPLFGTRFISVGDAFDSNDYIGTTGGMELALRNLVNEMYSKDLSLKIRSAVKTRNRRGLYWGGQAFYGYRLDPSDKHKLLVDEDVRTTIERIFEWCIEGLSTMEIAKRLNARKIPSPAEHKRQNGERYNGRVLESEPLWLGGTVRKILNDERYTGKMISGTRETVGIRSNKMRSLPREDWVVVEGTHEAIISPETYQQAISALKSRIRTVNNNTAGNRSQNLFVCGYCGRKLQRSHGKQVHLFCVRARFEHSPGCESLHENVDALQSNALQVVKLHAKLLLSKSDYIKNLDSSKREQIKSQIRIADMRLGHINSTKGFLYEEYRAGKYTKDRFKEIQQTNQMECERLQIQIKDLRKELEDWNKRYDAACNTTQSVKDILALSEYRPEVIARLVDQVRVFENGRVEIEFRNVDAFERLLLPESISHPMKHNAV